MPGAAGEWGTEGEGRREAGRGLRIGGKTPGGRNVIHWCSHYSTTMLMMMVVMKKRIIPMLTITRMRMRMTIMLTMMTRVV